MGYGKILVVEDNADILELVAYNLESQGYEVLRAMTGENGLAQVASHKPDLVVLDVMLPGINGLDVCRKLKQSDATRGILSFFLLQNQKMLTLLVALNWVLMTI